MIDAAVVEPGKKIMAGGKASRRTGEKKAGMKKEDGKGRPGGSSQCNGNLS